MKTLLLAAGGSQAYANAGHHYPKNLVEVDGEPLLAHVLSRLGPLARDGQLIVVVPEEEALRFHIDRVVHLLEPTAAVLPVGLTAGAACSALLAIDHIEMDQPLLVVNGDQVVDVDLAAVCLDFQRQGLDAGTVVFEAVHPRWSYVRLREGLVVEASEKNPISRDATAGIYWFRRGEDFVCAVQAMILKDGHVDGQFFICPALNELVLLGLRIGIVRINRSGYISLREPDGLSALESLVRAAPVLNMEVVT